MHWIVATVLTVYGIETVEYSSTVTRTRKRRLQQYLPFTVLKLKIEAAKPVEVDELQQYLPFTVLKRLQQFGSIFLSKCLQLQQYLPFTVLKLQLFSS